MNRIYIFIKKHTLSSLYIIAIPVLILYNLIPGNFDYDTQYYILAGQNILSGDIDCLRTPVYPLFLALCGLKGGMYRVLWVTIIQSLIYLYSIKCMYHISCTTIKSSKLAYLATLWYVVVPVPGWCNMLLSESLSISGCVILISSLIRLIQTQKWVLNILIVLLVTLLIFLRPTFIIFFAILPTLYIYQLITSKNGVKSTYVIALFLLAVPLGAYMGYTKLYEQEYGVATPSISITCNKQYALQRSKLWNSRELKTDKSLSLFNQLDSLYDGTYSNLYLLTSSSHDLASIQDVFESIITQHKREYLGYRIRTLFNGFNETFPISTYYRRDGIGKPLFALSVLLSTHLSFFYLITIIATILFFYKFFKYKKVSIPIAICIAVCLSQGVGVAMSAIESFGRILMPAFPAFIVVVMYGINKLRIPFFE